MKCSHGLPYEVKCGGCMADALARVGVAVLQAPPIVKMYADAQVSKPPYVQEQIQKWNKK